MNNIYDVVSQLGSFHDCRISRVGWDVSNLQVELGIDNIYSNFTGLPDCPVPTAGTIVLGDVSIVSFDVKVDSPLLNVYEITASEEDNRVTVSVALSPAGKMLIRCGRAELIMHKL